jgi:hypothetical protein
MWREENYLLPKREALLAPCGSTRYDTDDWGAACGFKLMQYKSQP